MAPLCHIYNLELLIMDYKLKEINGENFRSFGNVIDDIARIIYSFGGTYPDIKSWFRDKVIPGLYSGERTMLYVPGHNGIMALAILKDSPQEKKICTFYVSPEVRGKGLAQALFQESFAKLKTAKPLISVPESALKHFNKYIVQYKFCQTNSRFFADRKLREFEYNG
jgi:predicted GNAT family acetyltransferase